MEMAAMYCENRMTADWTYDIASLEHGRLPDCHRCHYLSSRQLIRQGADKSWCYQPSRSSPAACRTEFFRAMMRSMTSAAA
jgi:hypothetical protein